MNKSAVFVIVLLNILNVCALDINIFGEPENPWVQWCGDWSWRTSFLGPDSFADSLSEDLSIYANKRDAYRTDGYSGNTFSTQVWFKLMPDIADTMTAKNYPIYKEIYYTNTSPIELWLTDSATKLKLSTVSIHTKTSESFESLIDDEWHYVSVNSYAGDPEIAEVFQGPWGPETSYYSYDTTKFYVDGQFISSSTIWRSVENLYHSHTYLLGVGCSDTTDKILKPDSAWNPDKGWVDASHYFPRSEFPGRIGALELASDARSEQYIINHWNTYKPTSSTMKTTVAMPSVNAPLLSVFPNPAISNPTFRVDTNIPNAKVNIYNISGKLIESLTVNSGKPIIWRKNVSSGTYFCQMLSSSKSSTVKLLIQR